MGLSCCAIIVGVAIALLAGCGGAQPPIAQNATPQSRAIANSSSVMPACKTLSPLLYVGSSDLGLTPLRIYKADASDPEPTATISKDIDIASGACIDSDGTLYVANDSSTAGWISEYLLGHVKPVRVITKGISTPAYCAIDASDNLWVTNLFPNKVVEYLKGSTTSRATITQGLTYPLGIAIDHAGNLYVSNPQPYSAPNIQVYAPGAKSPSRTITEGVTRPIGIAIDAHGTLYVTNSTDPGNIEKYRSGQSAPYQTISDGLASPVNLVVDKKGRLYVANLGDKSHKQSILEFPPRSLEPSSRTITKGFFNPQGLAYYPPVLP